LSPSIPVQNSHAKRDRRAECRHVANDGWRHAEKARPIRLVSRNAGNRDSQGRQVEQRAGYPEGELTRASIQP
jgi:hypothetical protein